jgi:hypothetical protein
MLIAALAGRFHCFVNAVLLVKPYRHSLAPRCMAPAQALASPPATGPGADRHRPPRTDPRGWRRVSGQRWLTFIRNYLRKTWACDFFAVITARFQGLYVFILLSLERRRLVHVGVTEHPTAAWTAQRFVETTIDAGHVPRFPVHDRDFIFGSTDSFVEQVI